MSFIVSGCEHHVLISQCASSCYHCGPTVPLSVEKSRIDIVEEVLIEPVQTQSAAYVTGCLGWQEHNNNRVCWKEPRV